MEVLVAGGGIAGLTTALTCDQVGVSVKVLEAATELLPLGLGINLQPDAVRELSDLGLDSELASIGVETKELVLFDRDGREVWHEPRGREAGYRWPQYSIHRGELQMMLYRAVIDRLGTDAVSTGDRVTGYEHTIEGVRVAHTGSSAVPEQTDASVLLGADGLHSVVRAQMFPGEGGPRWGGSVLWRGISSSTPLRTGASFVVIGDAAQRLVTFPISSPDPTTGRQTQNWIAELRFEANRGWRRGDWNTRVSTDEFIGSFDDWRFRWLDVPELIGGSSEVFEYPMVDRDPVDHWVHGSVALVGDAAHPMYPVGSNGASQAIVDARVLGAALLDSGVGREALGRYESTLLPARSELAVRNRELGPASILGVLDVAMAEAFNDYVAMPPEEMRRAITEYRSRSASDVEALNSAPATISPRTEP